MRCGLYIKLYMTLGAVAAGQLLNITDAELMAIFGPPNVTTTTEFSLNPGRVSVAASNKACKVDGKDGVCVIYYQCDPKTNVTKTDGSDLIDLRINECPTYFEKCCLEAVTGNVTREPLPRDKPLDCGYSNPGAQAFRIVNDGTKAEYGEYPWMVAIMKNTEAGAAWSSGDYIGGGSLIHARVVLTIAHKVDGKQPTELKVRAGEWDTQTIFEDYEHQERLVKKIVIHEDFYRPSSLNNVALLFMEKPFELSEATPHMGIACIGSELPPPGTKCESMGWGINNFNNPEEFAVVLKKVILPLVGHGRCQSMLRGTRLGARYQLHRSLTCAGGENGTDTCSGDGGAPLVCPIGDLKNLRYAVFGAVAWGIGCGQDGIPGVYANIPEFRSWITEKMKSEGLDSKSYDYEDSKQ